MKKTNKFLKQVFSEKGQVSRILMILIVIVLILVVVIYGATKLINSRKSNNTSSDSTDNTVSEPPKPVYDITLSDTRFVLESFEDIGNFMKSPVTYQKDLTTTERFIKVTIGAQNKGKNNLSQYSWDIGNIVDSEGRNFISINDKAYYHLPNPNLCGALLKPEFKPTSCVKYYEVSKASKGLKVIIKITEPKKEEAILDLL